ncbi:hypothetical protein GCM10022399_32270 [Terrabacter ginsenosidimutans]|uniref:Uncharacterized protein n=1 Tax=Terrabacter ginsenosidimutans TaxID=490575 RepID=A0ABP7E1Z2_9MICO
MSSTYVLCSGSRCRAVVRVAVFVAVVARVEAAAGLVVVLAGSDVT